MPTLGEFIAHARRYGLRSRRLTLPTTAGPVGIRYLWRDAEHFAPLPDIRPSERLARSTVERLCRQLGIPFEDFGLE